MGAVCSPAQAETGQWIGLGGDQSASVRCGNSGEGEAIGIVYQKDLANKAIIGVGLVCDNFSWNQFNPNTSANRTDRRRYSSVRSGRATRSASVTFAEPRQNGEYSSAQQSVERAVCPAGRGTTVEARADSFLVGLTLGYATENGRAFINRIELSCGKFVNDTGAAEQGFSITAGETARANGQGDQRGASVCGPFINKLNIKFSQITQKDSLFNLGKAAVNSIQPSCVKPQPVNRVAGGNPSRDPNPQPQPSGEKLSFARDVYPVIARQCFGCHAGNDLFPQKLQTNAAECGVNAIPAIPFNGDMPANRMYDLLLCLKASSREGSYAQALGKKYLVPGAAREQSGIWWKAKNSDFFTAEQKALVMGWVEQGGER
jgi:hypothetical protein